MALNEAKEKVRQLENAIKKLDLIKKHLSHNASDIKGEIHSCVSHNLECLRGREVSLLSKVDEVVGLKEEALQQQQAQLNQALGVLRTRMALTTTGSTLDKQMADILTKFNEIELSPGETSHMGFRADHMALRECIQNYGRVDANALPLPSAFDDSEKLSACLPRHLEEYDDVDHHIFHKTVEEPKESKKITVSIPKLSTRMEDWLQKRLTSQDESYQSLPPSRPTILPTLSSNGLKLSSQSQSRTSTPGETCSLNNWLSQIKGHADLEEEHDFEIVDNSRRLKDKCSSLPSKKSDLKQWLCNAPGYMENIGSNDPPSQTCFQHIPSDPKIWLSSPGPKSYSLEEMKHKDFFHHISKEPATWLRSRAYGKHSPLNSNGAEENKRKEQPMVFKDKNINQWLMQSSKPKQDEQDNGNNNNCCRIASTGQCLGSESKQDNVKQVIFQLEDLCKANELCSSLSDCVCNPNCAVNCQEELMGIKNALDPTKVFNPVELPMLQWLLSTDDSNTESCDKLDDSHRHNSHIEMMDSEETKNTGDFAEKSMFSHHGVGSIDVDDWLFKPISSSSETSLSVPFTTTTTTLDPAFKHNKEEMNLWLQQAQESTSQEIKPTKVLFSFTPSANSLSEWLLTTPKLEASLKEEDDTDKVMKDDSEGWSICSTPTSFNSEQFSKDVGVATSYLQNWGL